MEEKKAQTAAVVGVAYNIIAEYGQRAANGEFTLEEAKKRAHDRVANFKTGKDAKDYVWVNDSETMLAHPNKDFEGKSLNYFKDSNGKYFLEEAAKDFKRQRRRLCRLMFGRKPRERNPRLKYHTLSFTNRGAG